MTRSSPPAPVRFAPGAAFAARRAEMLRVAEVDQRIEAGHGLEDDVAALAAVAAVGTAELDELLAPEADRAGSAGAGLHVDLGLVEEVHLASAVRRCRRGGEPVRLATHCGRSAQAHVGSRLC